MRTIFSFTGLSIWLCNGAMAAAPVEPNLGSCLQRGVPDSRVSAVSDSTFISGIVADYSDRVAPSVELGEGAPGACCDQTTGQCTDGQSPEACEAANGIYFGAGTDCLAAACVVLDGQCPAGAVQEGEPGPCAQPDGFNSGCNTAALAFSTNVDCGVTVCGQSGASGGTRDTDWYLVIPSETTFYTWTVTAEFFVTALIIELDDGFDPCASTTILQAASGAPGDAVSVSDCLAGDRPYVLFAAASDPDNVGANPLEGVACSDYIGVASCDVCPTGGCCMADGTCAVENRPDCENMGGIYLGNGTDCTGVECAGACCLPSGMCMEGVSQQNCGAQSGLYFGGGSSCAGQVCEPCLVEGESDCGDPLDTINGGCNVTPAVFVDIQCDDTICGSIRGDSDGMGPTGTFSRDTDWYRLNLVADTVVRVELTDAAFPAVVLQITPPNPGAPCDNLATTLVGVSDGTTDVCGTLCLSAGVHYIFVSTSITVEHDTPCPTSYRLSVSCDADCGDSPTGSCCTPTGCVDGVRECECLEFLGGIFSGPDTTCAGTPCAGACCLPDGSCQQLTQTDCGEMNGLFNQGVLCGSVVCESCTPENEPNCGDAPEDDINIGCNGPTSDPPLPATYSDISCPAVVCGTTRGESGAGPGAAFSRNLDWYRLTATPGPLRVQLEEVDFPGVVIVLIDFNGDCNFGAGEIVGFATPVEGGSVCGTVDIPAPGGTVYVVVGPQVRINVPVSVPCPGTYRLRVDCDALCVCDEPAQCDLDCDGDADAEGEDLSACDFDDTFNNGCASDPEPQNFSAISTGQKICGTTALEQGTRDTDWYALAGVDQAEDLVITLNAEFSAQFAVLATGTPIADCDAIPLVEQQVTTACTEATITVTGPVQGDFVILVAPNFATNPEICCATGAEYQLSVSGGSNCGACADSNCDGNVTVGDINFFVAAVTGGEAAWNALFPGGVAPCDFVCANDTNGDSNVTVGDINDFVTAVTSGTPCTP